MSALNRALLIVMLFGASSALATNRTVTNLNDSGSGSLRDAIAASDYGDTIDFAVTGVINLSSGELIVYTSLTINGPGANLLNIRWAGAGSARVLTVYYLFKPVTISGVTLSNGNLTAGDAKGGGIYNGGTLTLVNCAVSGNQVNVPSATNNGGAIYNNNTLTLIGCTLDGNSAGGFPETYSNGGAIYSNSYGTLSMTNCTLTNNSAHSSSSSGTQALGGALGNDNYNAHTVSLVNCTISGNSAVTTNGSSYGGGLLSAGSPDLLNNIIAGNSTVSSAGYGSTGPDINAPPVNSQGHNVIGNTNGNSGWIASDKTDASATPLNLGSLQNLGGPTKTMPLLPGSVAIDAGDDGVTSAPNNVTTDQRGIGFPRLVGNHVDAGAFELGATFIVTTLNDHDDGVCDSDCSLREAINAANAVPGSNIISFATGVTGTSQLGSALPNLSTNITIQGPGAAALTIRRNTTATYRIFYISNGTSSGPTVNLSGLTVSNGTAPTSGNAFANEGGGILNDTGVLTMDKCTITSNAANYGGGIFNYHGYLTIANSTFSGNQGIFGGAIYNSGSGAPTSLIATNSTFSGNFVSGSGSGGVMLNYAGTASFTNCTFYNNSASESDAGSGVLYNFAFGANASLNLRSCTLSSNVTGNPNSADVLNTALSATGTLTLDSTIFKKGGQGQNLLNDGGTVLSLGYNISSDAAGGNGSTGPGGLLNATGDIRNIDPLLGSLASNDGFTQTVALLAGSPAINHGDPGAPVQDQRYYFRTGLPDIGAYEFNGTLLTITSITHPDTTHILIQGKGGPNVPNRLLVSPDLNPNNFTLLTTVTADASGFWQYNNSTSLTRRFYKVVYP